MHRFKTKTYFHFSGHRGQKTKIAILLLITTFLLLSSGCKKTPTEPGKNIPPPGSRDYTWTVDTLNKIAPYNDYAFLWGTSATNVWCIGSGGDIDKMFMHYDGSAWKNFAYPGQGMQPWSIFGFTADDFWAGSQDGTIYRYLNGQFNMFGDYRLPGYPQTVFIKFWGNNPNDIYVVGCAHKTADELNYSIIMHYDGKGWTYVIKPEAKGQFLNIKSGSNDSPNYYLIYLSEYIDSTSIYEFDGKALKRIYNQPELDYNIPGMFSINNNIYFGFEEKLLKYDYKYNRFITLKDFAGANIKTMSHVNGRSENDLFINMNDGIGHYNGTDIQTIFKTYNSTPFDDAVVFEKDVFFLCTDYTKNNFLIVHGQLK
jgi:hypothetical protein